jgi:hypothetical protein
VNQTLAEMKAYVRRVIASRFPRSLPGLVRQELELDGLELYTRGLRGKALGDALIDRSRAFQRGSRSGISATGLAWEHGGAGLPDPAPGFERRLESRQALLAFRGEADLRDPRVMGRYLGLPSARALPTGVARELWPEIEGERSDTFDL